MQHSRRPSRPGRPPMVLLVLAALAAAPAPAADRLEAEALVRRVLEANPGLRAARAAWQAARARIGQVSALDDPRLMYALAPDTRGLPGQATGQKLRLSQRLPWPGKRRLAGLEARHQAEAAHQDAEAVRLRLAATARRAWAEWYFVHQALAVNRDSLALWGEFRRLAEGRYATGQANKQDALRAEMQEALLRHRAIVLERKRRDILAEINRLLHRPPDQPLPPPAAPPDEPPLPAAPALRAAARRLRPELRAGEAMVAARRARLRLARRDYLPDFDASLAYNSLWNQDEKRFTAGLGLNIPLALGRRRAALAEARSRLARARWRLADLRSRIDSEVQRAYDAVTESRHALALYRDRLLPLAEETLAAARSDYRAGQGDFLDLAGAERHLFDTRLGVTRARADLHRNLALLVQAVGRDPLPAAGRNGE